MEEHRSNDFRSDTDVLKCEYFPKMLDYTQIVFRPNFLIFLCFIFMRILPLIFQFSFLGEKNTLVFTKLFNKTSKSQLFHVICVLTPCK